MQVFLRCMFLVCLLPWLGIRLESLREAVEKQDVHFPYVVSIQILNDLNQSVTIDFYAAGALVSDHQVLSVCHKFLKSDEYWQARDALVVVAGASKLADNHTMESDSAQTRHVKQVIQHPNCYSSIPHVYGFDAAILTLKEPMLLNKHVQPITLQFQDVREMETELAAMENDKVVCNTFRWSWKVTESSVEVTETELYRKKRVADNTNDDIDPEEEANISPGGTEPKADDYPSGSGDLVNTQTYSILNVNKVLITTNSKCMKAFCKAAQPVCEHDFSANGQICTLPWEISNTTCMDVGGPLVCQGYLFGILNFESCLLERTPSVFAGPASLLELLALTSDVVKFKNLSPARKYATLYPMCILLSMVLLTQSIDKTH